MPNIKIGLSTQATILPALEYFAQAIVQISQHANSKATQHPCLTQFTEARSLKLDSCNSLSIEFSSGPTKICLKSHSKQTAEHPTPSIHDEHDLWLHPEFNHLFSKIQQMKVWRNEKRNVFFEKTLRWVWRILSKKKI